MERKATAHFNKDGEKYFETPDGVKHTYREGSGPYEYLMGALAGCFTSTLLDYEHEGVWGDITVTASGTKRKESPTVLEHTSLEIVARNISDKEEFDRIVQKTQRVCSIYQTIKCVSAMDTVVRFEDDEE